MYTGGIPQWLDTNACAQHCDKKTEHSIVALKQVQCCDSSGSDSNSNRSFSGLSKHFLKGIQC